jgi:hypothetical protein
MGTFTNPKTDTSTEVNAPFGDTQNMTWNGATFTWAGAGDATWQNPRVWNGVTADTSIITNVTRN